MAFWGMSRRWQSADSVVNPWLVGLFVMGWGGCYFSALFFRRAISAGQWVRCRDGVVEVLSMWRWHRVGYPGAVTYVAESGPNGTPLIWLEGEFGRKSFSLPAGTTLKSAMSVDFLDHVRPK